jgi:hypothetical protein
MILPRQKFSLVEIKESRCMDMIFTDNWQLYFRLFFVTNWCLDFDGYSHEFLEVYEKDGVKENGWTIGDCCFEI